MSFCWRTVCIRTHKQVTDDHTVVRSSSPFKLGTDHGKLGLWKWQSWKTRLLDRFCWNFVWLICNSRTLYCIDLNNITYDLTQNSVQSWTQVICGRTNTTLLCCCSFCPYFLFISAHGLGLENFNNLASLLQDGRTPSINDFDKLPLLELTL